MSEPQTQAVDDSRTNAPRAGEPPWQFDRERYVRSLFRGRLTRRALKHELSKEDLELIRAVGERELADTRVLVAPFMTGMGIGWSLVALGVTTGWTEVLVTGALVGGIASLGEICAQAGLWRQSRRQHRIDEMLTRA